MKKLILAATLFLVLSFKISFAVDRIVEETGTGGAYTSITTALAASLNGDRIVIIPRMGNAPYVENITVVRSNLKILSATPGTRYLLQGSVTFTTTATGSMLMDAEILSGFSTSTITNNANDVRITGCKVAGNIICNKANNIYIDNDSIYDGKIQLSKGRVTGCTIQIYHTVGSAAIYAATASITAGDTLFIIGNRLEINPSSAFNYSAILIDNHTQIMYVANNLVTFGVNTAGITSGGGSLYGITIDSLKVLAGYYGAIINNTLTQDSIAGVSYPIYDARFYGPVDMENNIISVPNCIRSTLFDAFSQSLTIFKYNHYIKALGSAGSFTADGTNTAASNALAAPYTGILPAGCDAIDGGNPSGVYTDIDLTPNDAGCFGGSYSLANFTVPETGARVLFMKAPRNTYINLSFSISADGLAK